MKREEKKHWEKSKGKGGRIEIRKVVGGGGGIEQT